MEKIVNNKNITVKPPCHLPPPAPPTPCRRCVTIYCDLNPNFNKGSSNPSTSGHIQSLTTLKSGVSISKLIEDCMAGRDGWWEQNNGSHLNDISREYFPPRPSLV